VTPGNQREPSLELASVLFIDVVGYSTNNIQTQRRILERLQVVVKSTDEYKHAEELGGLIKLPTGDGMALVFSKDPVSPVRCAVEIHHALKDQDLPLRMGIHTGPLYRTSDIKDNINVVGGGINLAQRAMDVGDAGHILVTRAVAEVLEQLEGWPQCLKDLGDCEVKHGVKLQLYNLVREGVGNAAFPSKVVKRETAPPPPKSKWPMWAGIGVVVAALAGGGAWYASRPEPKPVSETPVVPQTPKHTLSYFLYQNNPDGSRSKIAPDKIFQNGDVIKLVLSSPESGNLYIMNVGPESTAEKPDINAFFPKQGETSRREAGKEITKELHFDAQEGAETLCVIWANQPISELEPLQNHLDARGTVKDPAVASRAAAFLERHKDVHVDVATSDAEKQRTLTTNGPVLAYQLRLEHH
jgi:class 3 adenylate cyclase